MTTDQIESIEYIKSTLENNLSPCYHTSTYSHIYCRCPKCGDSKNKSSAHLYIKLTPPFPFYCQKCGYSGRVDSQFLESLSIYDTTMVEHINKSNKNMKVSEGKQVTTKKNKVTDINETLDEQSQSAIDYLNNRFNSSLDLETLNKQFKCVTKPNEYIKNTIGKDLVYAKFDFSKSIGFVSSDNKYLICRDITNSQSLRYLNVALSQDEDKSKIYNIRTPINILNPTVTLVITEGIFDCIGIYLKEYQNKENVIVAAGCGKSYSQVVEKFISMGFLNLDVKFYADADVDLKYFIKEKRNCEYIQNESVEVYYNTLDKDCGVSADKIQLRKTVI